MSTKYTDNTLYGQEVDEIVMIYLDLPNANNPEKRFHSGLGIVDALGQQWHGVGNLGSISAPKESIDLQPTRVTVTVSAVVRDVLNDALNADLKGRVAELYVAYLDGEGKVAGGPHLLVKGTMGAPSVVYGEESSISFQVIDFRERLKRKNGKRFNLPDHQADHPGDLFYEFVAIMEDFTFVFMGQPIRAGGAPGPRYGADNYPGYDPTINPNDPTSL